MDKNFLKNLAKKEGLVFLDIVPLNIEEDFKRFKNWLSLNFHGELKYLERNSEIRCYPKRLFYNAKSAMVFGLPVNIKNNLPIWHNIKLARFARFFDYHKVIKNALHKIAETLFKKNDFYIFCDTSPILERALAAKTGCGFIGKNSCYIDYEYGSFFMLGGILTSMDIKITSKNNVKSSPCDSCEICIKSCPFQAIVEPYIVDVRKCFAYWSTSSLEIPPKYLEFFKEYLWGCDICQEVCPFNDKPSFYDPKIIVENWPSLSELARKDSNILKRLMENTVFSKRHIHIIKRNALIALNYYPN